MEIHDRGLIRGDMYWHMSLIGLWLESFSNEIWGQRSRQNCNCNQIIESNCSSRENSGANVPHRFFHFLRFSFLVVFARTSSLQPKKVSGNRCVRSWGDIRAMSGAAALWSLQLQQNSFRSTFHVKLMTLRWVRGKMLSCFLWTGDGSCIEFSIPLTLNILKGSSYSTFTSKVNMRPPYRRYGAIHQAS